MKYLLSCLSAMFLICSLSGAEKDIASGGENRRSRLGRSERMSGGRRSMQMLEQLKDKYPAEVAELEKLRSSDPAAARAKMRQLMDKAGIKFPGRGMRHGNTLPSAKLSEEQLKELKSKLPLEFEEYEKLKKSDPEKADAKLREMLVKVFGEQAFYGKNLRDRQRRSSARIQRELARLYPDRYAEMEKIRQTDLERAREILRELYRDSGLRSEPGARELVYEYVDPKQNNNNMRSNMQRIDPMWGGGRMMPPWAGGRR